MQNAHKLLQCLVAGLLLNASAAFGFENINWIRSYEKGRAHSAATGQPAFIYFHALWCSWCYVYERDTLGNEQISHSIKQNYVPVLVNYDARPDLVEKYRGFGLPFTVILSHKGELLARLPGILSARDMQQTLQQVINTPAVLRSPVAEVLMQTSSLDARDYQTFLTRWLQHLDNLYDPETGTFSGILDSGATLKRPAALTWGFLLKNNLWPERTKRAALATLENLYDSKHGGFFYFRDSHRSDRHLETAKRLDANAWLIDWFAHTGRQYTNAPLSVAAKRSGAYLQDVLWDKKAGGFFQAQVSDRAYYKADNIMAHAPALDKIKRTDSNAQAAIVFLQTGRLVDSPALVDTAVNTLRYLFEYHLQGMRLYHSYSDDARGSVYNLAEDIFWLLAAMQAASDAGITFATPKQTQKIDKLASQWLATARQSKGDLRLSNKLLGIIAWVAINSDSSLITRQTANWALRQIRIEPGTRPDELVYALKAWQQLLMNNAGSNAGHRLN